MSGTLLHAGLFAGGLLVGAGSTIALLKSSSSSNNTVPASPPPGQAPTQPQQQTPPPSSSSASPLIIPPPGALALLQSDILRPSGYPGPISDLLPHTVFISSYDRRLRHPSWTAEHLTAASLRRNNGGGSGPEPDRPDRSRSVFKEDERIPLPFRARLADYFRSGYDRGHMVPAADAKISQQAMDETFLLTNMAPQVGAGFNRDYWAHTEDFVRRLTNAFADVYVFTLPLYLPRQDPDGKHRVTYEVIGNPPNVAVPTHFAKVILASGRPGRVPALPPPQSLLSSQQQPALALAAPLDPSYTGLAAFVIPNAVVPNETPLRAFDLPLDAVERAAGLTLFPDHVKAKAKHLCSLVTCDIIVREFADRARSPSPTSSVPAPQPGSRPVR
ncbi:nuclease [Tilletia horrida]|nr:nuclease [Tilletia horrida]